MQGSPHFPALQLPPSPSLPLYLNGANLISLLRSGRSAEWSILPSHPKAAIFGGGETLGPAAEALRDVDWLLLLAMWGQDWRIHCGPSSHCLSGMRRRLPSGTTPFLREWVTAGGVARPRAPSAVSYPARAPRRAHPSAPGRALGADSLVCFCWSLRRGRSRDDAWEAEGENRGRAPFASDGQS